MAVLRSVDVVLVDGQTPHMIGHASRTMLLCGDGHSPRSKMLPQSRWSTSLPSHRRVEVEIDVDDCVLVDVEVVAVLRLVDVVVAVLWDVEVEAVLRLVDVVVAVLWDVEVEVVAVLRLVDVVVAVPWEVEVEVVAAVLANVVATVAVAVSRHAPHFNLR